MKRYRLTILGDILNESFPYYNFDSLAELNEKFDPTHAEQRGDGYWEMIAPDGAHVLLLNRVEHPHYLHVTWELIGVRLAQCY